MTAAQRKQLASKPATAATATATVAFAAGAGVLAWVGAGYASSSPLALAVTLLIGAVYALGGLELQRYHRATTGLQQALATLPADLPTLDGWLQQLHPSLRHPVRLRIAGERVGLPGPALAPYLVGLLVLLGMLGTFVGMVATLRGTAAALQTSTDLATIRAALTAPVQGLGLAFGTSVAGVAASAMLGLVVALCRRARLLATRQLDGCIATTLQAFSQAHQRALGLQALQALQQQQAQQAQLLPVLVEQLQAAMAQMAQQGQTLGSQLLAGQEAFHRNAQASHSALAAAVAQSLQQSLADAARLASASITPLVQATMDGIRHDTHSLHQHTTSAVQQQLDGLAQRFEASVGQVADTWQAGLAAQQAASQALQTDLQARQTAWAQTADAQSAALLARISSSQHSMLDSLAARDAERLAALVQPLQAMASSLRADAQLAGSQALAQQEQICRTLEATAARMHSQAAAQAEQTVQEVASLLQAAGEAPRAAAEAMAQLRRQLSDSLARDNSLLEERSNTLATLNALLATAQQGAADQRSAIDSLVAQTGVLLQQASDRQAAQAQAEADKLAAAAGQVQGAASQVAAGALEVASLGDAFGAAVAQFGDSNQALTQQLQRIEAALGKNLQRSDEQLAYYVAQAREIIDLSLLSQKQIVDDLQQLAGRSSGAAQGSEAA